MDILFSNYIEALKLWNKNINLVQKDTLANAWQRHFADSLQLQQFFPENSKNIIDIGSGAGFPGMVLSIATQKNINLIEPNLKKAVFLEKINTLYNSPATIINKKWQELTINNSDLVISRAYTSLNNLLECMNFVSRETQNAVGLFLKGEKTNSEIAEAKIFWNFDYEIYQSETHEFGKIIKIMGLKAK